MNNINEVSHDNCVGCGACIGNCPVGCITLQEKKGFFYPVINEKQCIQCGKCKKVCAVLDNNLEYHIPIKWYAGYAGISIMPKESTSGGICTLLSKQYIKNRDNVYAAAFDDEWNLVHRKIDGISELEKFSGSKYLQSIIPKETYFELVQKLKKEEKCLFIGTSCQIASVLEYLKEANVDLQNLLTIDFMCHGIPSPILGRKFIKYLENQNHKKIKKYNFRSKENGWGKIERTVIFENGEKKVTSGSICPLHSWFGHHLSIRKSCFSCSYRKIKRVSDITVADFWGIEKYYPEIETKQGVSAIQINTEKGGKIYNQLVQNEDFCSYEVSQKSMWNRKTALNNFSVPDGYDLFWKNVESMSIKKLIKVYPPQTMWGYVKEKIKFFIRWN